MTDGDRVVAILHEAKGLAQEYRRLTGKPLGVTGEVAEYEVHRILGIELQPARQTGYDAIELVEGKPCRLQIKGRCLQRTRAGSTGKIDLRREWDAVLLVLLDENLDALEIHQADRKDVEVALTAPGSKARNERGQLAVSKFRSIATLRWKRPEP